MGTPIFLHIYKCILKLNLVSLWKEFLEKTILEINLKYVLVS